MFALRWNDKQRNSLRIDSSITEGMEVDTKTDGSDSFVWIPASIDTELEFWRGACNDSSREPFIFASSRGTAINTNNFVFRILKEAAREVGIAGVTHQMLRRTCSTYMAQLTTVKECRHTCVITNAKPHWSTTSNPCRKASGLLSNLWISC